MRGQGRRVSRPALLVGSLLVASVMGCDATASSPGASRTPAASDAPAGPFVLADVPAFRGSFARTGQMPGPGPDAAPVELWHYEASGGYEAQPLIADGVVIVVSLDGELAALDGVKGAVRKMVQLDAGVSGTPAISGNTMFVVTHDGVLRALSVPDFGELWNKPGYDANAAPSIAGDLVLAGAPDGTLVARRIADGADAWTEPAEAATRVSVADGRVAVTGVGSGQIKMVALDDRSPLLDMSTGGAEAGTAAQIDGSVYVAHRDVAGGSNGVQSFDATGKLIWS